MSLSDGNMPYTGLGYPAPGQSLLEFALIASVLSVLLMATWTVGVAMHVGSRAASAVQEPLAQKMTLAGVPGDATATAQSLANGFNQAGLNLMNPPIDNMSVQATNTLNALILGSKKVPVSLPGLNLTFNYTATQLIPSHLLAANAGAGRTSGSGGYPGVTVQGLTGLLTPLPYGFTQTSLPKSLPLVQPDCTTSATLDINAFNTLVPPTTPAPSPAPAGVNADGSLSAFPTLTSAGSSGYSTTYAASSAFSPATVSVLMTLPNSLCDPLSTATPPATPAQIQACKFEMAGLMLNQWVQSIQATGGCTVQTSTGGDVTFATNAPNY